MALRRDLRGGRGTVAWATLTRMDGSWLPFNCEQEGVIHDSGVGGILSQVARMPTYYLVVPRVRSLGTECLSWVFCSGSHKAEIKGSMLFQVVGRIIFLVVVGLKSQFPWHMIFFIFQPKQYILRFPASNSLFSLMLPARVGFLLLRAHVIWLSPFNNPG